MDKKTLRTSLITARANVDNRLRRNHLLTQAMRIWLLSRRDTEVGAYWPIKGEFDPLPALSRWKEDGALLGTEFAQHRRLGLPVLNKDTKQLSFHVWYPGCETEMDAYDIPKPKGTDQIYPTLLFVPCVGFTVEGGRTYRLGYGGGFYDRTLASLSPRPYTVGLAFDCARADFAVEAHDMPLDTVLTENGVIR